MERLLDRRPWTMTLLLAVVGGGAFHLANLPNGPSFGLWIVPAVVVLLGITQRPVQLVVAALLLAGCGAAALLQASWSPVLTVAMVVYWLLVFLGGLLAVRAASRCLPSWLVFLVFPCLLVAVEWGTSFTPVGTVLSWAYLLHESLLLIQVVAVTGVYGPGFLVALGGSAAGMWLLRPRQARVWGLPVLLAVALLAGAGWYGARALRAAAGPTVTVAAVHAESSRGNPQDLAGNLARLDAYRPLVAEAASRGARLVVWPEMILTMQPEHEDTLMTLLGDLARRHGVHMVLGLRDTDRSLNILRVFAPDGRVVGEYHKNHLLARSEGSTPGTTPPAVVATDFGALGTMICNDDTFTDLARANAHLGARLVADPTWDWSDVAAHHARMPRFRAAENGLAIVRAARGGESQLIDPQGRILARHDVLTEARQVLVGDLPLGDGDTVYARFGDVFAGVVTVLLGMIFVTGWLSRMGDARP
jgi:apolipoprotein N-acyltransferase